MSKQLLESLRRKVGMPVDAKTLTKELDGNPDMVNETVLAIEEVAGSDPAVEKWWSSLKPKIGSGGSIDTESFVPEVIASLGLDKKTGIRGKKPEAEETVNKSSTPATDKADKGLLPEPPKQKGGKKAAAAEAAKKPAAAKQEGKQAPAPAAAPKARPKDPEVEQFLNETEPVPGTFGAVSRGDAVDLAERDGGMALNPQDYLEELQRLESEGGEAVAPSPAAMDMSRLSGLPTYKDMANEFMLGGLLEEAGRDGYADPDLDSASAPFSPVSMGPQELMAPYRTGQFDSDFSQMTPMPESVPPGTINPQGGFGGVEYGPEPPPSVPGDGSPQPKKEQPWSPLTSRSDAFFKARGLDGMAGGARYLTKPADAYIRNWGLTVPATIAGAAIHQRYRSGANAPTEDEVQQMQSRVDEARRAAEQVWGTVDPVPAKPLPNQQARPL